MVEAPLYVVDASTAVKWFLEDEEYTQEALALLDDYQSGRVLLLAPDNVRYEIGGAIRRAVIRKRLTVLDGRSAVETYLSLKLRTVRADSLIVLAYDHAFRYGCTFYDGLYLALAELTRCPLVCADRRLRDAVLDRFPLLLWIGDYRPGKGGPAA